MFDPRRFLILGVMAALSLPVLAMPFLPMQTVSRMCVVFRVSLLIGTTQNSSQGTFLLKIGHSCSAQKPVIRSTSRLSLKPSSMVQSSSCQQAL